MLHAYSILEYGLDYFEREKCKPWGMGEDEDTLPFPYQPLIYTTAFIFNHVQYYM